MKAVIVSDLHLREDTAAVVFEEVLPGILAAAADEGAGHIVCLGDVFHLRYRVPVSLLCGVNDWLVEAANAGVEVTLLPGNHDQVDTHGRNVLEVFAAMPHVTVCSDPVWREDGLWVPYRPDVAVMEAALRLPRPRRSCANVCWLHGGVRGALRNSLIVDDDGLEQRLLDTFDWVFCGHYHRPQSLGQSGKIVYVGSPYQTRADEAGQDKGYLVFDDQACQVLRRTMAWGPRYITGRAANIDELVALAGDNAADATILRATLAPGVDMARASAALEAAGHTGFTLTSEVAESSARLQVHGDAGMAEYAEAYVRACAANTASEQEALLATFATIVEAQKQLVASSGNS